jgi:hypothetical protein
VEWNPRPSAERVLICREQRGRADLRAVSCPGHRLCHPVAFLTTGGTEYLPDDGDNPGKLTLAWVRWDSRTLQTICVKSEVITVHPI